MMSCGRPQVEVERITVKERQPCVKVCNEESRACFARGMMVNSLGMCLDTKNERSLHLVRALRMPEKISTTSSIEGRFAGLTCVIQSTRSCINSKPLYF